MSKPTPIPVTPQLVRQAIEERFKLAQLPLNETLARFDLKDFQLISLRMELNTRFKKDVPVRPSDTIYTLTDKLNA